MDTIISKSTADNPIASDPSVSGFEGVDSSRFEAITAEHDIITVPGSSAAAYEDRIPSPDETGGDPGTTTIPAERKDGNRNRPVKNVTSPRRKRILRRALVGLAVLAVIAGGTAYWALNRFVIDHVEVANVSSYEADLAAAGEADTGIGAETAESVATEATVTEDTYTSATSALKISKVVTGTGSDTITYYVADLTLTDATALKAGLANNQFGTNIVENTSTIAQANNAIFAINGDYYGFRDTGIVIRNGVLYRDEGARTGLAIYRDGRMEVYDETTTSGDELVAAGVFNTLSFGPALLDDGAIPAGIDSVEVDTNFGNHSVQGSQPRTGIGVIDTNHFVFVVADGRSSGYSKGVTMTEFAQIFKDLGATEAYNLDGGGSSTMYFDGHLVNNPLGKGNERGTSDILYLAA